VQASPEYMSGELDSAMYAFYDKTKDVKNNGWVWFHKDLKLDQIRQCYQECLLSRLGNGVPDGLGFVVFESRLVLYKFFPAGKDDKGRDHWVLLLAWLGKGTSPLAEWKRFEGGVFRHVEVDKENLSPQLSEFDYRPECTKLMYSGGELEVDIEKGREYIQKLIECGKVDVVFYREKPNKRAVIETVKKGGVVADRDS